MRRALSLQLLAASLFLLTALRAQDIHFSQYYLSPQLINPAVCGAISSFEAGLQYKSQWQSVGKGYTTYAAFAGMQLRKPRSRKAGFISVGINAFYDQSGDGTLTNLDVNVPVSYQVRLNERHYFSAGLYAGIIQRSINMNSFTWGTQFDGFNYNPKLSSYQNNGTLQNGLVADAGLGLAWIYQHETKSVAEINSNKNVLGISASHLNRPDYALFVENKDRLQIRYNLYEYCHIFFENSNFSIIPNLLVQVQGPTYEVVAGNYFRFEFNQDSRITGFKQDGAIGFGVYYRHRDGVSINSILEFRKYSLGLSYDLNFSPLRQASSVRGGLELCLKVNTGFNYLYRGYSKY